MFASFVLESGKFAHVGDSVVGFVGRCQSDGVEREVAVTDRCKVVGVSEDPGLCAAVVADVVFELGPFEENCGSMDVVECVLFRRAGDKSEELG